MYFNFFDMYSMEYIIYFEFLKRLMLEVNNESKS